MCSATENACAVPTVRVRNNSELEIQQPLDVGAESVEIPQIAAHTDAFQAVGHLRFAPTGSWKLPAYVEGQNI
jgi:2-keto-3-deoxy-L-rhamnonate aldolase RhmA